MTIAQDLNAGQIKRYTPKHPCPVCGGHKDLPQGKGIRCYGHDDSTGSYALCTREERAGGLPRNNDNTYSHRLEGQCQCGRSHGMASPNGHHPNARTPTAKPANDEPVSAAKLCPTGYREVQPYDWTDVAGAVQYQSVRYEHLTKTQKKPGKPEKTFRIRRPVDGQPSFYRPNLGDVPRVVFRKDRLAANPTADLHWPEGEAHALALEDLGLLVTTTVGGAQGVRAYTSEELRWAACDRNVILHTDADPDGAAYVRFIAETVAPVAKSVRIVGYDDFGPGGDVLDAIRAGADADALQRRIDASEPVASQTRATVFSARDLERMHISPLAFAIPGLLPQGTALLCGSPKVGKSRLALQLGLAVSFGGVALSHTEVAQGDVLALCLEDGPRRLQERLNALLAGSGTAGQNT